MTTRRAVLAAVVTIACFIAWFFAPSSIRLVFPVFVLWFIFGSLNLLGLAAMADHCDLTPSDIKHRRGRDKVASHMDRTFWLLFWGSGIALLVQSLIPLALLATSLSVAAVLVIFGLNLAGNIFAIPVRGWIWKIRISPASVENA